MAALRVFGGVCVGPSHRDVKIQLRPSLSAGHVRTDDDRRIARNRKNVDQRICLNTLRIFSRTSRNSRGGGCLSGRATRKPSQRVREDCTNYSIALHGKTSGTMNAGAKDVSVSLSEAHASADASGLAFHFCVKINGVLSTLSLPQEQSPFYCGGGSVRQAGLVYTLRT